jgi:hypothetical protein
LAGGLAFAAATVFQAGSQVSRGQGLDFHLAHLSSVSTILSAHPFNVKNCAPHAVMVYSACSQRTGMIGLSAALEEALQEGLGFLPHQSAFAGYMVMEDRVHRQGVNAAAAAVPAVKSRENAAVQARQYQSARAHRAGLKGDKQGAAIQAPARKQGLGPGNGQCFSMGKGIVPGYLLIMGRRDDFSVMDDYRSDRYLFGILRRKQQGGPHRITVSH